MGKSKGPLGSASRSLRGARTTEFSEGEIGIVFECISEVKGTEALALK